MSSPWQMASSKPMSPHVCTVDINSAKKETTNSLRGILEGDRTSHLIITSSKKAIHRAKLPKTSKVIPRPFAGLYTRNHHQRKSHPPSFLGCHSSDPNFYAIKQANKSSHTWFLIKALKKPLCLQLITSTITGWRGHEILTALDDCLEFSKSGHPRLPFASTTRTTAIKVSVPSGLDVPKYPGQTAWQIQSHFTVLFELAGLTANMMVIAPMREGWKHVKVVAVMFSYVCFITTPSVLRLRQNCE